MAPFEQKSIRHLTPANHVYEFDPGQDFGGRSKGFETEHGPGDALDGPMVRSCRISSPGQG